MSAKKRRVHIVGAGINGLTVGSQLARRGFEVTVLERQEKIGGLARTLRYGDFSFDIGPHRFHTDIPGVGEFIESVLGDESITIKRCSSVYLFGKQHPWPLRPRSLLRLPKKALFHCFIDLFNRPKFTTERFDDYIKNKYGPTLYRIFFYDYTLKYCWVDPSQLHASWAAASIDRAIVDKRASMNSLWDTLKVTLMPHPISTDFVYPKHGTDVFCYKLADTIQSLGGRVITEVQDISLTKGKERIDKVTFDDQTEDVDLLVWTAPVTQLTEKLGLKKPRLRYLSSVAYNIELDHKIDLKDQWIYFPSKNLAVPRVSFPENFSPHMVPEGKSGVCAEITTLGRTDPAYAESKRDRIIQDLEEVGVCTRQSIVNIHTERVGFTYPLYELEYLKEKAGVTEEFSKFKNLHPSGRTGLFWYNNMDNSIDQGLRLADQIAPVEEEPK